MADQNYIQRQETFNDIFGGIRHDVPPAVDTNDKSNRSVHYQTANPQYHHQSLQQQQGHADQYNPGVQYENVPDLLLLSNLPDGSRQPLNAYINLGPQLPKNKLSSPGLRSEYARFQVQSSYASEYAYQQQQPQPQPVLQPEFAPGYDTLSSPKQPNLPYPVSPQVPGSGFGSVQNSPARHTNIVYEDHDEITPLNVSANGRRFVSAGHINHTSRSMSGLPTSNSNSGASHHSYPYVDQARAKSLTTASYGAFRSQTDPHWQSRNISGRTIPSKMDLWNAHNNNNGSMTNDSYNHSTASLTAKARTINALQRPVRSASSMSARNPTRTQTSISSSKALFSSKRPIIYPALLSKVSKEFRELVVLGEKDKNGLTYRDAFTGQEAINVICSIIRNNDRGLSLLLGRALDAQKFFHDVTYEHRLRDSKLEVYQFNEVLEGLGSRQDSFTSVSQVTLVGHNGLDFDDSQEPVSEIQQPQQQQKQNSVPMTQAPVKVNGVFTLLTECYSPTCTRDRLCYSIACPRRFEQQARLNMKPQGGLKRIESKSSVHGDESSKLLWSYSVPKEILESVDDREKKRQEIIFETIYTERDFVKDLEYIKDFWIIPLRTRNIIPERERELFIRKVFGGINEILMINSKMAEELTARQKQQPVVFQIGDIFINFIPRFHPFVKYAANRIFGKYEFERQKQTNPAFAKFVQETERLKESRKLDLSSFLSKPTSRPARYPLLLQQVLKKTKDDNPDKKNIKKAIEMLEKLLAKINKETGYASDKYQLAILKQQLVFKPGEFVDLKLTDDQRRILYNGHLTRRNNDDIQVYLLDSTLLFVKIKQVNKREQHKVFQRPIPIQLLHVSTTEEPPSLRSIVAKENAHALTKGASNNGNSLTSFNSNGANLGHHSSNGSNSFSESNSNTNNGNHNNLSNSTSSINTNNTGSASNNSSSNISGGSTIAPSNLSSSGISTGATSTLTEANRTGSSASIIGGRTNTLKLDLSSSSGSGSLKYPLSFVYIGRRGYDMTLYAPNVQVQRALLDAIEQQQQKLKRQNDIFTLVPLTERFFNHQTNRINCAIPFYGGRRLVCGTDSGIFVSTIRMCVSDNKQSRVVSNPINVIDKPNVTQIEVLDDYQTLLAICDKKLYCWPLDVLESFNVKENSKKGKELLTHVSFFKVGVCDGKRLVCAAKNGSSHSIKIFEPIDPRKKIAKKKFKSESKEMPFNSEIVSISFLKSKLCIVGCSKGFQVVSIEHGSMEQLLDPADTSLDFATRREGLRPIAIYKLNSDYLLSYSEFSFFVDVNGWRSRPTWIIHWEGLPQSFALWYPYLLSFDNNFIEIRDCNTSELLRIITGEGIRLLHASSQEILYAYVDSRGYDVVASLDFWDKANKNTYPTSKAFQEF